MAWQPQGMSNGGGAGGENNVPAGTEYTLQGVLRFLQLEWHGHERLRNAWDIERAEMKAKIASLEGKSRHTQVINGQLERQVKMLERALKAERAKSKALASGDKAPAEEESKKDVKAKSGLKPDLKLSKHNSFLDTESEAKATAEAEKDAYRDKSRTYLQKCVEEMTYLLQPPAHPPPSQLQSLANSSFLNHADSGMSLEDVYMQQRQRGQQQGVGFSQQAPVPNHQPPPVPSSGEVPNFSHTNHAQQQQNMFPNERQQQQQGVERGFSQLMSEGPARSTQAEVTSNFSTSTEEPVEQVTHSYDSYGRPVTSSEEQTGVTRQVISDDTDGWNFDESTSLPEPPPELPPTRRPDQDLFPNANNYSAKSPPRTGITSHGRRRSSGSASMSRRRSEGHETRDSSSITNKSDSQNFKVKFALRGHLDVVRAVIFTGGGSPSEPEICTAGDDGTIKRWIIPASYSSFSSGSHSAGPDLDIASYFSHRGHEGSVACLAACPSNASFSTGGRISGDGWIFSGGQDATVRVWERGRVDPKATLDGHTDAVWAVCVLPATCASVFGSESGNFGGPDRVLLASGSADGTVKIWAVSAPPQLHSPSTGSRRGVGGSRRHSVTSGSHHPSSPQPSIATNTPFHYTLVHSIERAGLPSPTCISPLSLTAENFVVSYNDASILIFDTRTGEELIGMASSETYDGTPATGINAVVATTGSLEAGTGGESGRGMALGGSDEDSSAPTGSRDSVEGVVISGHEDRFIRFFDANSGQCTYNMLAHPSAISSLSLSPDGREAVSAGHDASIRFWSLEKRICTQEMTSHRPMRGEGVCGVVWSQDGRLVVSAGGDGVVKVFAR